MNTVWMSPHLLCSTHLPCCVSFSPMLHAAWITVCFSPLALILPKSHKKRWVYFYDHPPDKKKSLITYFKATYNIPFHYLLSSGDIYGRKTLGTKHNLSSKLRKQHFSSRSLHEYKLIPIFPSAADITSVPPLHTCWVAQGLFMSTNLSLFLSVCWYQWNKSIHSLIFSIHSLTLKTSVSTLFFTGLSCWEGLF